MAASLCKHLGSKNVRSLRYSLHHCQRSFTTTTTTSASANKKWLCTALGIAAGSGLSIVYALEKSVEAGDIELHPQQLPWSHSGLFASFDVASIRRGYQVYKQVCAACHSLKFVAYRHFVDVFMTEEQAKAEAAEIMVMDGPNDEGKMFERSGKLFDYMPNPYPNKKAAAAANNGSVPPDLSLITLARHGGEDYVFSILTGYQEPPAGVKLGPGQSYNPYMLGGAIAMPQQLFDEGIEYDDGTPATMTQQAKDVTTFLRWCGEPEHDQRKLWFIKMLFITPPVVLLLLYWKRHNWSVLKSQKIAFRTVAGRERPDGSSPAAGMPSAGTPHSSGMPSGASGKQPPPSGPQRH